MGELLAFAPSSLTPLPQFQLRTSTRGQKPIGCSQASLAVTSPVRFLSKSLTNFPISYAEQKHRYLKSRAGIVSDTKVPTTFTVDSAGESIDILPDSGGPNDSFGGGGGNGGGGGGGNGGDGGDNKGGSDEDQGGGSEQKKGMSMSQKLTLGYAALVGIGGLMGYIKGGSQKSLIAGGVSASLLFFVYSILPSNPVLASAVGLGLSASLLVVMGSRFKKSGKIFPAGVVSVMSFIMSGGYLHGILRSSH